MINGPYEPTKVVDGKDVIKNFTEWNMDESKRAHYDVKAKNIISSTLTMDEFFRILNCTSAKEMWDVLEVTREGTDEVKTGKENSLVQEYEMFRMKAGENIYNV